MAATDTSLQQRGSRAASEGRLARGVLSDVDIAAATLAGMAPAMGFFFGFATIVTAARIAAPLTMIAAAVAIGLLGNTLSQFSRSRPSTGSFCVQRVRRVQRGGDGGRAVDGLHHRGGPCGDDLRRPRSRPSCSRFKSSCCS